MVIRIVQIQIANIEVRIIDLLFPFGVNPTFFGTKSWIPLNIPRRGGYSSSNAWNLFRAILGVESRLYIIDMIDQALF